MKKTSFFPVTGLAIFVSALFSTPASAQLPIKDNSLRGATKIASTVGWYVKQDDSMDTLLPSSGYHWLNNEEILLFKNPIVPAPFRENITGRNTLLKPPPYGGTAYRLDTKTGSLIPLPSVTQQFKGSASEIKVSPDGQSIIMQDVVRSYVLSLDGSRLIRLVGHGDFNWINGGKSLLETNLVKLNSPRLKAFLHTLDNPNAAKPIPIKSRQALYTSKLEYVTTRDRSLYTSLYDYPAPASKVTVYEDGFGKEARFQKRYAIRFAANTVVKQVVFSRDGSHIAWLLSPRASKKATGKTALWISRLDGTQRRRLLVFPTEPDVILRENIAWSPSGDRLSFIYKNELYTIPTGTPSNGSAVRTW